MDSDAHVWNGKQKAIVATTVIMMSLSTISFILRLYARWQVGTKLWWDDYCAFIALFFSYGPNILAAAALHFGLAMHQDDLAPNAITITMIAFTYLFKLRFPSPSSKV